MKFHTTPSLLSIVLIIAINGCASAPEQPAGATAAPESASAVQASPRPNDYPTRDRVEYVLNCVAQHGGLTYITQYACGCKIDKIAEKLTFEEYEAAKTFSFLRSTPGDAGGVFRDPAQSKDLRSRLKEAEAYAEKNCFVK